MEIIANKLNLVSREEFEIQVQILQRACQEIDSLKTRISKLEEKVDVSK